MNTSHVLRLMAILALLSFVSATNHSPIIPAQEHTRTLVNWTRVAEESCNCSFSFPSGYQTATQTGETLYTIDSNNLTYQMAFINTANVDNLPGQNFQANVNAISTADRLTQFVTLLAQGTNGQVISQFAVNGYSRQGRDVELTYTEPEGDQTIRMFARIFWNNNTIWFFSVSAPTQYTNDLLTSRNLVFNSLIFI